MLGGVYHSGTVLFDSEYTFASGTSSASGIHSHRPKQLGDAQWKFRETLNLGEHSLDRNEVRQLIAEMKGSGDWAGNSYSLTGKNCNHFSEALAKALGVQFPSWINRGAKVAGALGMGTGKQASAAVDHEGRPLRPEDAAALVMDKIEDLCVDSLLDLKKCALLGAKPSCSLASIIPLDSSGKRVLLKADKFVQSDADEQLLLFLPFTKPVKLLSILLRLSAKDGTQNPKSLKFFVNQPNLNFSDVDSVTPSQTIELAANPGRVFTKEENKEGLFEHVIQLTPSKFAATSFLTIYIESNHGAAQTKLSGLTIVGRDK